MEELIRTKVSRFELKDSLTLDEVRVLKDEGRLEEILVPIDQMFDTYESVYLKDEFISMVYNGNVFFPKHMKNYVELTDGKMVRVYDNQDQFIAIYKFDKEKHLFRIEKMFFEGKK